jgi:broad specificity phosphatase PhoE
MKIYIIRHGQSLGDIEKRYGGNYDDDLSDLGRTQAEHLANELQNAEISIVYCSPLQRAQKTAEILAKKWGSRVITDKDLRERNRYGVVTAMKYSEAVKKYPDVIQNLNNYTYTPAGGENYQAFKKRVIDALNNAARKPSNHAIAIVTHGGPISTIAREILKLGESKISDCAYIILDFDGKNLSFIKAQNIVFENQK